MVCSPTERRRRLFEGAILNARLSYTGELVLRKSASGNIVCVRARPRRRNSAHTRLHNAALVPACVTLLVFFSVSPVLRWVNEESMRCSPLELARREKRGPRAHVWAESDPVTHVLGPTIDPSRSEIDLRRTDLNRAFLNRARH